MNSTLQALSSCTLFVQYIKDATKRHTDAVSSPSYPYLKVDDDDAELVEYITVNGKTVRTNCNPGGPPIGGGLCSDIVKHQTPTCVKNYQLNTTSVQESVTVI